MHVRTDARNRRRPMAYSAVLGVLAFLATACLPYPPTTNFFQSFGSTVYRTQDGGVTWDTPASAPTVAGATAVKVIDLAYGPTRVLTAVGTATIAAKQHAVIWTSLDRGNTWTVAVDSPSPGTMSQSFVDVTCTGSRCAALGQTDSDFTNFVGPIGFVYLSNDGGWTWTKAPGMIEDRGVIAIAVAPSGTLAVAARYPGLCIGTICASFGKAVVFRADASGTTWEQVYISPPLTNPDLPGQDLDNSRFFGIVDAGGTFVAYGALSSEPSQLLRSTDDGHTWNPSSSTFNALTVGANGWHVIAVGSSATYLSNDAGATFTPVAVPPAHGVTSEDRLTMAVHGRGVVLVGTRQGGRNVLFTSDDGGLTWAPKTPAQPTFAVNLSVAI
jgi:photosystem II stability/assembly factor-like uncharacterized protein